MHDQLSAATLPGDDDPAVPRQYRLAWRWKESGTTGQGPWMHRADIVEAWADSLNRRWEERMEHWMEAGPAAD